MISKLKERLFKVGPRGVARGQATMALSAMLVTAPNSAGPDLLPDNGATW